MKMMTRLTASLALLFVLGAAGTDRALAVDAKEVFTFYCAQCHGLEGNGDGPNVTADFPVTPRKFSNADEMNKLTDADLRNAILDGGPAVSKSAMMPPWSKTLTDEEVGALVGYLRELCACEGKTE